MEDLLKDFRLFLDRSVCNYFAIEESVKRLEKANFIHLKENERWKLKKNEKYFLTRDNRSIIAFTTGNDLKEGFRIIASHSDSPTFKVKRNPEIIEDGFLKLNVESYGGMIVSSWFDRTLSLAGEISYNENGKIKTKLVNIDKDLLSILNLAIHINREINNGYSYNIQKELLPIVNVVDEKVEKGIFLNILSKETKVSKENILDFDLNLYDRQKSSIIGDMIQSGRLDNLEMAHASLCAIIESDVNKFNLMIINDNEEIGSMTRRGANSTFLSDTLKRIYKNLGYDFEDFQISLSNSFMISADSAHSIHPNYTEKFDPTNRVKMGEGLVIKIDSQGAYTSDIEGISFIKKLAKDLGLNIQTFYNRSDQRGGSTLGPITASKIAIKSVDVGNAIMSMHSIREMASLKDHLNAYKIFKRFYN
ncbi:MAG: M18 family aminopeptidase [Peptoniphilaceae bacterium]|nr:M18 family aminopeptidase [Peptoniphilaceae bacterium]MDD7383909.1 M18 family aminopeptidase [Peptoniphilaceae bacterium]MDY3738052.1 M18 family aminopeptidase [Peptoniphilaceae bacterium]